MSATIQSDLKNPEATCLSKSNCFTATCFISIEPICEMDLCAFRPNNITLINCDVPSWPSTFSNLVELSEIAPARHQIPSWLSSAQLPLLPPLRVTRSAQGYSTLQPVELGFPLWILVLLQLHPLEETCFSSTIAVFCVLLFRHQRVEHKDKTKSAFEFDT